MKSAENTLCLAENQFGLVYNLLYVHYGPQYWWPGETAFEILVGAVLTQNTNWRNVERAILQLKQRDLLSFEALYAAPDQVIADAIRPAGYYNLKTRRLNSLLQFLADEHQGDVQELLQYPTWQAREKLLAVKGIGPETADSILLYCGGHPIFVVDAYTYRVFSRHALIPEETDYHEIQEAFMTNLPHDPQLFNEYHALIVRVGKEFCKKRTPLCRHCPLKGV